MPAEHAILGLLASTPEESSHGYELARRFGPDAPLGNVIRLEPGMVYHHLKKIERLGWVAGEDETAEGRPARRVYALTVAGGEELRRWLAEPVTHTREIRIEFLLKLYFALLLDPPQANRLIAEQREQCARLLEALAPRAIDNGDADSRETRERRFASFVRDMRFAQTQAALEWLDRVARDAFPADSG
ncbi:MAG: PadR family transcriptional regulator [Thermomicrobiales bacterium]